MRTRITPNTGFFLAVVVMKYFLMYKVFLSKGGDGVILWAQRGSYEKAVMEFKL